MFNPQEALILGQGRKLSFIVNRAGTVVGFIEEHPDTRNPGAQCIGSGMFDTPEGREYHGPYWKVISEEPLTLSPSILCTACGNHGFVTAGHWQAV